LFCRGNARLNDPSTDDLYAIGTLSRIERMIRTDGEINAQVRGLSRVKSFLMNDMILTLWQKFVELPEEVDNNEELKAFATT